MSNWIDNFQADEKAKKERAAIEAQQRAAEHAAASSRWQATGLRRDILAHVETIAQRVGVKLIVTDAEDHIAIRAPRLNESLIRHTGHDRLEIYNADDLSAAVTVCLTKDGRIEREGDLPDNMSPAQFYGTEEKVILTRVQVVALRNTDIHRLLEWLVRSALGQSNVSVPVLSGAIPWKTDSKAGCAAFAGIVMFATFIIFWL